MPADAPLFPVPKAKRYLTWEPDGGGLNNIRMQVRMLAIDVLSQRSVPAPSRTAAEPLVVWRAADGSKKGHTS